jgi:hypothetical protein
MTRARSSIVRGFRADMHWIRCRYPDQTSADRCRRARQSVLPGALSQHRARAAQWRARASLPPPARRDFRLLRRSTLQQRLPDSILTLRSRRHHQAPPALVGCKRGLFRLAMICHAAPIYIELLMAPCVLGILGRRLIALLQGARPRPIDLTSLRKARCCNDG